MTQHCECPTADHVTACGLGRGPLYSDPPVEVLASREFLHHALYLERFPRLCHDCKLALVEALGYREYDWVCTQCGGSGYGHHACQLPESEEGDV